jgi:mannosyltransferase
MIHRMCSRARRILPFTVILLAFALRLYLLDNQSFAFDEGWTSYAIHHSWREMWGVLAPDNHPPLYYVLVKAFADVAGYGDFAVRFVSVLCGTALVAGLYVLGKRLGGEVGGLSAALFAACSPSLIYYAQEARMYSLWMALAVLSSYSLTRLATDPCRSLLYRRRWWVGYVLATVSALYTHYFTALLILIQNGVALVWLVTSRTPATDRTSGFPATEAREKGGTFRTFFPHAARWIRGRIGRLGRWAWAQGTILLLYLPWLPTAIRQVRIAQGTWWRIPLPPRMIFNDIWLFYILGPRRPRGVPKLGPQAAGIALAVFVALLVGWRRRVGRWAFALSISVLPVALFVLMGTHFPIYTNRYTLVAAPGLALLVGTGVSACWDALPKRGRWLGRAAASLLLVAALAGPLPQLDAYYGDPRYWREDFRRAAQYVMDTTEAGDTIILLGCWQPIMQYYQGPATMLRFPQRGDSVQSEEEAVSSLRQAIHPDSQVRLVMHSWPTVDPQGLVEGQLRSHCRLQGEHWQRETGQRPIRVMNFEGCSGFAVEPRQPIDAVWEDQIALTAFRLIHFVPGKQAHAVLWWRTSGRPAKNYSVFVHLMDAGGKVITQFDKLPLNDFYPMRAWPPDVDQRDDYPLNLPVDANLDGAWLAVGVYNRAKMERLTVRRDGVLVGDFIRIPLAQ